MPFVLDASATISVLFPDEAAALSAAVLARLRSTRAVVPTVWPLEVVNALLIAERRRRITEAITTGFIVRLRALSIEVDHMPFGDVFTEDMIIARRYALSAYDASYLELALRRGLPLATMDHRLRTAARAAGVALLESDDA